MTAYALYAAARHIFMRCSILGETTLAVLLPDRSQNLEANQSARLMEA